MPGQGHGRERNRTAGRARSGPGVVRALAACAFSACALGAIGAGEAQAGAWLRRTGEAVAIVQASVTTSSQGFGPDFGLYSAASYDKVEVNLVLEYGATDWLTLIAAPQYLSVKIGEPTPSDYGGPGYVDFGARARLYDDGVRVLSFQAIGRAPGASGSDSAAAVGYTDWELDLRLLAGVSFSLFGAASFLDLEVAQRQRFGVEPDEFRFDATLGVRVAPRWQVLLQSFNVISEGAGDAVSGAAAYEYYKAQAGILYDLTERLTLQAAAVTTYLARNAPQENGLVLGGIYRF